MQKIIIDNFAAIEHLEMELDWNLDLVIGPQASGKSALAKLVFFCRKIRDYLTDYLTNPIVSDFYGKNPSRPPFRNFTLYLTRQFMRYFGKTTEIKGHFVVKYFYDDDPDGEETGHWVKLRLNDEGYLLVQFSPQMYRSIRSYLREAEERLGSAYSLAHSKGLEEYNSLKESAKAYFSKMSADLFHDTQELIYIPAGRSILSYLSDNVEFTLTDLLLDDYVKRIRALRPRFTRSLSGMISEYVHTSGQEIDEEDVSLAAELVRHILRADYRYDLGSGEERLYYSKKDFTDIRFASSGQQESLWILQLMFLIILEKRRTFLVLEEPEVHLFPFAQKAMVELIALLIHATGSSVFVTTHSPYILTSANLSIYSAQAEPDWKSEQEEPVVPPSLRIEPDRFGAYMISNQEGFSFESIQDPETGLIDAFRIDQVSEVLNRETDRITYRKARAEILYKAQSPKERREHP